MTNKYRDTCKELPLCRVLGHLRAIARRMRDDKEFERELVRRYEQLVTQGDHETSSNTGPTR